MPRSNAGTDPEVLSRPTAGSILKWALVGVLLTATVGLGWWGITMREQQRDLLSRLRRLQEVAPDRVPPLIVRIARHEPQAMFPYPAGRWIVFVFEGEQNGELRLELRSGGVSVWTAVEPVRRGVAIPPALPASLMPPGEYELRVNERRHRLLVTAAAQPSSATSGPSGT